MLKTKRFWISTTISLIFIYLSFHQIDGEKAFQALADINPYYLPAAIGIFLIGVLIRCIRWSYQLNHLQGIGKEKIDYPLTPFSVFPSLTVGYFANNVLPARLGELARTFSWHRKSKMSNSSVLGTIMVGRLFDGLAMLTLAVVMTWYLEVGKQDFTVIIRWASVIFISILILSFLIVIFPTQFEKILDKLLKLLPSSWRPKIRRMVHSFSDSFKLIPNPTSMVIMYVLSLLAWLFEALVFYLVGLSFGLLLPYHYFIFTGAIASLWTLIPSAPGYAGTFDYASIKTLKIFGVASGVAESYTVVVHLVLWLPITLLGGYFAWREGLSFKKIKQSDID